MSRHYRPVTPEQEAKAQADREAKLQGLQEQLEKQVAAMHTGDDWQRWLAFAARFHDYSFQNTLLILSQRPDAEAVAGFDAWRQMGRQVGKGQKGIAILAPIIRRPQQDDSTEKAPEQAEPRGNPRPRVVGYRPTYVWDVTQTTGTPLPERPSPQLLKGAAPDGLWDGLASLVEQAGYQLERGDCGNANGLTNPMTRIVRVRDDLDDAQAVKTLAHELGHVQLHCTDESLTRLPCRGLMEVEAESVAYLVTASHGLDSGTYTFAYVTGWASGIDGVTPEQAIRQTGQRVLTAARWVLEATQTKDADRAAQADQLAERVEAGTLNTGALRGRAEAVRARAGLVRPGRRPSVELRDVSRGELLELHREATRFFRATAAGAWVPEYLDARGLSVALDEPWSAGWAPSGWTNLVDHLRALGTDDAALLASGLATTARTGTLIDRFRDRLMIPLRDGTGDVVGFIGRAAQGADPDRVPKYLNSPQTAIYTKGELLFGLPETQLRLSRGAMPVLVEGPLDAMAVTAGTGSRCAGLAPCGTALTEAHIQQLAGSVDLRTRGVVVATDADAAGHAAAATALDLLTPYGVSPTRAGISTGSDPAELFAHGGGAELTAALLDRGRPLADVVIDARIDSWQRPLRFVEERVGAMRDLAPLVASLPIDDVRRQVGRLARQLDLDVLTVQREIATHLGGPNPRPPMRPAARAPVVTHAVTRPSTSRAGVPAPGGPRRSRR